MDETMMNTELTEQEEVKQDELKIVFGDTEAKVLEAYALRTVPGTDKVELHVKMSDADVVWETVKALEENKEPVYYYINGDLNMVFDGYTGEALATYKNGIYEVVVKRVGESEAKIAAAERKIAELQAKLDNAYEMAEQAEATAAYAAIMAEPKEG